MPGRRSWYVFIETERGYIAQPVDSKRQACEAISRLVPVVPDGAVWSIR